MSNVSRRCEPAVAAGELKRTANVRGGADPPWPVLTSPPHQPGDNAGVRSGKRQRATLCVMQPGMGVVAGAVGVE